VHILTESGAKAKYESGDLSGHTDALEYEWRWSARSDESGVATTGIAFDLDGDTTDGNYRRQYIRGENANVTAATSSIRTVALLPAADADAGWFGTGRAYITDPNGTTANKVVMTEFQVFWAGVADAPMISNGCVLHKSTTTAITSFDLDPTGSFISGSTASLWKRVA
jgi:hypothetical protein